MHRYPGTLLAAGASGRAPAFSRRLVLAGGLMWPLAARAAPADESGAAEAYGALVADRLARGRTFPRARLQMPWLGEAGAYVAQAALVRRRLAHDRPAGIKGGVLTPAAQRALGVGPVTGVLFRSGALKPGAVVDAARFRRLMLEVEVGFELTRTVSAPLADLDALRRHVGAVRASVELPDDGFEDRAATGVDLIAANVLSHSFIPGPRMSPATPVSDLRVTVTHDGRVAHRGDAKDAHPEPWRALLRLVNDSVARRGPLARGSLVLTGALGGAFPGRPGRYEADFGPLGVIRFSVAA